MTPNGLLNDLQNQKITVRIFLFTFMGDNLYSKKAIIKERISELKTKKFRFEINRIQLPNCLLYTSPSPRDLYRSRMPSSA